MYGKESPLENVQVVIPDGEFEGVQSGYEVRFSTPNGTFKATSTVGIREAAKCLVIVRNGEPTVSLKTSNPRSDWLS